MRHVRNNMRRKHFDWQHGRKLAEHLIVYVSEGTGTLETEDSTLHVDPGDAILLVPDMWHRYKPDEATGWHEQWVPAAPKKPVPKRNNEPGSGVAVMFWTMKSCGIPPELATTSSSSTKAIEKAPVKGKLVLLAARNCDHMT
jgi:hypothetical protein